MFICAIGNHPTKAGEPRHLITTESRPVVYENFWRILDEEGRSIPVSKTSKGEEIVVEIAVCPEHRQAIEQRAAFAASLKAEEEVEEFLKVITGSETVPSGHEPVVAAAFGSVRYGRQ